MQASWDYEKQERARTEQKLLETEKENNNLSVDISQLRKQVDDLKGTISEERQKVRCYSLSHESNF